MPAWMRGALGSGGGLPPPLVVVVVPPPVSPPPPPAITGGGGTGLRGSWPPVFPRSPLFFSCLPTFGTHFLSWAFQCLPGGHLRLDSSSFLGRSFTLPGSNLPGPSVLSSRVRSGIRV